MDKNVKHIKPYSQEFGTMIPLGFVKAMRTCIIYQIFRFIVLNLKMLVVVSKSH